jgi:hypothetical protein
LLKQREAAVEEKMLWNGYLLYPFLDEVRLDKHMIECPILGGEFLERRQTLRAFLSDLLQDKLDDFHERL